MPHATASHSPSLDVVYLKSDATGLSLLRFFLCSPHSTAFVILTLLIVCLYYHKYLSPSTVVHINEDASRRVRISRPRIPLDPRSVKNPRKKQADLESKTDKDAQTTTLAAHLRQTCPLSFDPDQSAFAPAFFISNGHLQTFYAAGTEKPPAFLFPPFISTSPSQHPKSELNISYDRELLTFPDGGICSIDWQITNRESANVGRGGPKYSSLASGADDEEMPIILFLHGLTGGSEEAYVKVVIKELTNTRNVVMNFRGCSDTILTSPQLYCGAYTGDVEFAIEHVRSRFPNAKIIGVGFSLGANVLTKYVATAPNCPLHAAISIANPFDLLHCSRHIHSTVVGRYVYSPILTQNLLYVFEKHLDVFLGIQDVIPIEDILSSRFVYNFDNHVTKNIFGYRTVDEYYRVASSAQYVPDIKIPFIALNALDDPISIKGCIPFDEIECNPNCVLVTTAGGGHLGWWAADGTRWYAAVVAEWIQSLLEIDPLEDEKEEKFTVAAHEAGSRRLSSTSQVSDGSTGGRLSGEKNSPRKVLSSTAIIPTVNTAAEALKIKETEASLFVPSRTGRETRTTAIILEPANAVHADSAIFITEEVEGKILSPVNKEELFTPVNKEEPYKKPMLAKSRERNSLEVTESAQLLLHTGNAFAEKSKDLARSTNATSLVVVPKTQIPITAQYYRSQPPLEAHTSQHPVICNESKDGKRVITTQKHRHSSRPLQKRDEVLPIPSWRYRIEENLERILSSLSQGFGIAESSFSRIAPQTHSFLRRTFSIESPGEAANTPVISRKPPWVLPAFVFLVVYVLLKKGFSLPLLHRLVFQKRQPAASLW